MSWAAYRFHHGSPLGTYCPHSGCLGLRDVRVAAGPAIDREVSGRALILQELVSVGVEDTLHGTAAGL
jgi:hypothetical protein